MFGPFKRHLELALGLVLITSAACRSTLPTGAPAAAVLTREPVSVAVSSSTPVQSTVEPGPASPESRDTVELGRLRLRGLDLDGAPLKDAVGPDLGDVDWTSVARMNHGTPSMMSLGGGWGMSMSTGMDRLEECEPTLALTRHGPGFTDTFVFVAAHYRLSHSAHLVGSVAGIRAQDETFSDVVDQADVSAFTLGVRLQF